MLTVRAVKCSAALWVEEDSVGWAVYGDWKFFAALYAFMRIIDEYDECRELKAKLGRKGWQLLWVDFKYSVGYS